MKWLLILIPLVLSCEKDWSCQNCLKDKSCSYFVTKTEYKCELKSFKVSQLLYKAVKTAKCPTAEKLILAHFPKILPLTTTSPNVVQVTTVKPLTTITNVPTTAKGEVNSPENREVLKEAIDKTSNDKNATRGRSKYWDYPVSSDHDNDTKSSISTMDSQQHTQLSTTNQPILRASTDMTTHSTIMNSKEIALVESKHYMEKEGEIKQDIRKQVGLGDERVIKTFIESTPVTETTENMEKSRHSPTISWEKSTDNSSGLLNIESVLEKPAVVNDQIEKTENKQEMASFTPMTTKLSTENEFFMYENDLFEKKFDTTTESVLNNLVSTEVVHSLENDVNYNVSYEMDGNNYSHACTFNKKNKSESRYAFIMLFSMLLLILLVLLLGLPYQFKRNVIILAQRTQTIEEHQV